MPVIISYNDLPNAQYSIVKFNEENVMMSIIQTGVVLMYVDRDVNLFVPWIEVVEFAATSPNKKPIEDIGKEQTEKKSGVREVKRQL